MPKTCRVFLNASNPNYSLPWYEYYVSAKLVAGATSAKGMSAAWPTATTHYCPTFLCPSNPVHMSWWSGYCNINDYLYNGFAGATSSNVTGVTPLPTEASLLRNVSRTIMFAEDWKEYALAGSTKRGSGGYAHTFTGFNRFTANSTSEDLRTNVGQTYGAHNGSMTTGFMDGHAESIKALEVNTNNHINVWDTGTITSRTN